MEVKATEDGQPCLLVVSGDVDHCVADDLVSAGISCLQTDSPGLTLNFAAVTFLDCSGMGALVRIRNFAISAGKRVTVVDPIERVARVLKLTGLEPVFLVESTQS